MTAKGKQWRGQTLMIEEIKEHRDLQLRANGISLPHVNKLARQIEAGKSLPPIKVAAIGTALYVVDGFHRLHAYKKAKVYALPAEVARMSLTEAREEARVANTTHGKGLGRADKQRVWKDHIANGGHLDEEGKLKPSRVIEAELNGLYSRETIRQRLRDLGLTLNEGPNFEEWKRDEPDEEFLAQERLEDAENMLASFIATVPTLDPDTRNRLIGTARGLLDGLERGQDAHGLLAGLRNPLGI